jgi:DNA-binding transcriptional MerR regulator
MEQSEKLYYSISEVAEKFHVASSLLRYWESEFPSIHPKKNKKGDRKYTKEDIEAVELVYHLVKERGYKLKAAQQVIKDKKKVIVDQMEMIHSLENVKTFLTDLKNKINK